MQFKLLTLSLLSTLSLAAPTIEERTITAYTIKSFTRDCTDSHVCKYDYVIDTGEARYPCTFEHRTPILNKRTGPLATNTPFSNIACQQDNRWLNSWGWDYPGDFTVLTVCHDPNHQCAFFGYKSPNNILPKGKYVDNGPNKVTNF